MQIPPGATCPARQQPAPCLLRHEAPLRVERLAVAAVLAAVDVGHADAHEGVGQPAALRPPAFVGHDGGYSGLAVGESTHRHTRCDWKWCHRQAGFHSTETGRGSGRHPPINNKDQRQSCYAQRSSLKVPLMMSGAMPDRNTLKPRRLHGHGQYVWSRASPCMPRMAYAGVTIPGWF